MSFRHWLIAVALILGVTGCATTRGTRSAPLAAGRAQAFAADHPTIVAAAREAMAGAGLTIREDRQVDDSTWMLIGDRGITFWSYGEIVRVVVQKTGRSGNTVRVHTRRRVATNVTARGDYSEWILSYIALRDR